MSSSDDDNRGFLGDTPVSYAIFPFVCLGIAIFVCLILYVRRRRRRAHMIANGTWPGSHAAATRERDRARGIQPRRTRAQGNRWNPWGGTRDEEGLNELGEAPPPYDGKRGENANGQENGLELRDLEANRPPEYPAEPEPVMTRPPPLSRPT